MKNFNLESRFERFMLVNETGTKPYGLGRKRIGKEHNWETGRKARRYNDNQSFSSTRKKTSDG